MPKGKSDRPTFKPYDQSQIELLPPTADELIPAGHLVRVVNEVVERMDVSSLLAMYGAGGGANMVARGMGSDEWGQVLTFEFSGARLHGYK